MNLKRNSVLIKYIINATNKFNHQLAKYMTQQTGQDQGVTLNFKVSHDFKWEYKQYAANHSIMMNWILQRSFEVYRGLIEQGLLDSEAESRLLRGRFRASVRSERGEP